MKFEKKKLDNLLGQTEVRYISQDKKFAVVATQEGIRFEGESQTVTDRDQLNTLASIIGAAWKSHVSLKPKLVSPQGVEM